MSVEALALELWDPDPWGDDEWVVNAGAPLGPVSFPTTPLRFRLYAALDANLSADPGTWAWQDLTGRIRFSPGIDITTGRRGESDLVDAGSMGLHLSNTDGYLTRRNPSSPYFGLLTPNTPLWLQVDAGSGFYTRAEMFVNAWPNRWPDQSGNDCIVAIEAAGVLRRLEQGSRSKSALRRTILAGVTPDYYAPMEEGPQSTVMKAINGLDPVVINPLVVQIAGATGVATKQYPVCDLTRQIFEPTGGPPSGSPRIKAFATTTGSGFWRIGFSFRGMVASTPLATQCAFIIYRELPDASGFGSTYTITLSVSRPDGPVPNFYSVSGPFGTSVLDVNPFDGDEHYVELTATQNGGNVDATLTVDYTHTNSASTAATLDMPLAWYFSPTIGSLGETVDNTGASAAIGQVVIYSSTSAASTSFAGVAYKSERAHARLSRLCDEENIPYTSIANESPPMGPQLMDKVLPLMREAEAVSGGVLYEKRWGLGFIGEQDRNNAPVSLALDFTQHHVTDIPQPEDDDRYLRNRWTVDRPDGIEKEVEQTVGPLSTDVGVYEDSASVNVETDDDLIHQAGWRVHLGTIDEDRWPNIALSLTRTPSLIDTYAAMTYGARMTVSNPPAEMPQASIDATVEGISESINPEDWTADLNTAPASIYRVHVVGGSGNLGRVDSKLSTLTSDITSGATSISVSTTGVIWDTAESGFDIEINGERITVTAISGASSPQTFTVTRSVNGAVKAHVSGTRVSLWKPAVYALVG